MMSLLFLFAFVDVCKSGTCGSYVESDVAVGVWSYSGDQSNALCQRDVFLNAFTNHLIVGDEADAVHGVKQVSGALPPALRNYDTAARKQFLLFVDLFDEFPFKDYYVVLDTDSLVFQDVLLAELNELCHQQTEFVGGYVRQELVFGGFMVLSGGAVANLTSRRNFIGCMNAIEDAYRKSGPIWINPKTFVGGDHYVTYCAHMYEFGPRVPVLSMRGANYQPCNSKTKAFWLSCHHVRGCGNITTQYARGVQWNNLLRKKNR